MSTPPEEPTQYVDSALPEPERNKTLQWSTPEYDEKGPALLPAVWTPPPPPAPVQYPQSQYPPPGYGPNYYGHQYGWPAPTPGYNQPGYSYSVYPVVPPRRTNGLALGALITGIMTLVMCQPAGVIAIIMGHIAKKQAAERNEEGAGLAIGGIITGWVGVGVTLLLLLLFLVPLLIFGAVLSETS